MPPVAATAPAEAGPTAGDPYVSTVVRPAGAEQPRAGPADVAGSSGRRSPARTLLANEAVQVALLLALAIGVRLLVHSYLPVFASKDTPSYLSPAWELAEGEEFALSARRTPLYPLFVFAVLKLGGYDLRHLVLVQHLLGVASAGLAYLLGRMVYGRAAGLIAGLLVALSGPLLVYERFVMSETLYTTLLLLALLAVLLAARRPRAVGLILAGLALGLAILTRPLAQVLLPLLPLALLLRSGAQRSNSRSGLGSTLRACAWYGFGLALVLLPWSARNWVSHGGFGTEGALGQALISRTLRHDDPSRYYECSEFGSGPKERVRKIICDEGAEAEPSDGEVGERVRRELRLSPTETNRLLRDVALEAIARQPLYFIQSSLQLSFELFRAGGRKDGLDVYLQQRSDARVMRVFAPGELKVLFPAFEGDEESMPSYVDVATSLYRPSRWWPLIGVGVVLAIWLGLRQPAYREGLLIAAATGLLVAITAGLDGANLRYRFPLDPLFAILAAGGLIVVGGQALRSWRRRRASSAFSTIETSLG
jgi:4-amino-4-deoxy-L-arabinose transferase-like glycosyltransferase